MKIFTKEDIQDIKYNWNGILVAIPKKNKALFYDSDFYMYSKYVNHENKFEYHRLDYNKEDSFGFATSKLNTFSDVFQEFDNFDWYKFTGMVDFCKWFLEDNGFTVKRKETTAKMCTYKKLEKKNGKNKSK